MSRLDGDNDDEAEDGTGDSRGRNMTMTRR